MAGIRCSNMQLVYLCKTREFRKKKPLMLRKKLQRKTNKTNKQKKQERLKF